MVIWIMKLDKTVLRETKYIAVWVAVLGVMMQAVFALFGAWNYTVLLGNLLSGTASVLNFLFMGITVQKAVTKEPDAAKSTMKVSQLYRMLFLLVVVIVGVVLPCFDRWSVILPLFFPRIAIAFHPLFEKK